MSSATEHSLENKGLFKAATWIAVVILISKIFGFLRDVVVANYYGAGLISDAYFYAYQIPALALVILGGVGGPFHSATVAIFSKVVTDFTSKPTAEVKKLFNTFETVSLVAFAMLALICFFFPKPVMNIIISSNSEQLLNLAAYQLKLMSPIVFLGSVIGIYYGILVTYRKFLLPNISPTLLSIGLIATLLVFKQDTSGMYLALGTTFGAMLQLLVQIPAVYKLGFVFKPTLASIKDTNFKDILELLFPAFLSSTIGQIGLYVDMFFSSSLQEGAWTALGYANRIFQFPIGMLLSAFLVPLFPLFSRLVGQKKYEDVAHYFKKGVGSLFFIGAYLMVMILIVRTDAIKIALERGAFTPETTLLVSDILFFITLSILPYAFRDSATRLLYAFSDSKSPFYVATFSIILKIILNLMLVPHFGIYGIAISTTLITLINGILLGIFIKRKMEFKYFPIFIDLMKILAASLVAGGIGYFTYAIFTNFFAWGIIIGLVKICVVSAITLLVYIAASYLFKIEYADDFARRIIGKFKNAPK